MHRHTTLTALATLTLTAAACGDNYEPVEVDDDRTSDFARATVDLDRQAISEDYVVPSATFSYASTRMTDRVQWADEVDGIGYPGSLDDVHTGEQVDGDISTIEYVLWGYEIAWAPLSGSADCADIGFNTAPDEQQQAGSDSAIPTHQGPDEAVVPAESDDSLPSAEDVTTGEAIAEELTCGAPIDNNDSSYDGVCQCQDLSCVADYVNETMGCDACMTFICGDELLGACAACTP